MPRFDREWSPELPLGTTTEAASDLFKQKLDAEHSNKLALVLRSLLSKTNELVHAYWATMKQVGPYVFPAALTAVGGTLSAVMLAPHVATLATALTGLVQSSGVLALSQSFVSCVAHCLNQAATVTALLGQSLLNLVPATANLGVAAAQAVGTSVVTLLSALSAALLAPAVVNSAKFVGHSVVDASNVVGHKVSSVVGSLREKWNHKDVVVSSDSEELEADRASSPSVSSPR